MKKVLLCFVVFLLAVTSAFAVDLKKAFPSPQEMKIAERKLRLKEIEKKEGLAFQHIPFGAGIEDVYEELRIILHYDDYIKGEDYIYFRDFRLGDRGVDIFFSFDHEGKLYSFSFQTPSKKASDIDPYVLSDLKFLTETFKSKYGATASCFDISDLNILTVKENYITFFCKWQTPELDMYTGLSTHNFEYYAKGGVSSKKRETAFNAYKEQKTKTKATEGAKSF